MNKKTTLAVFLLAVVSAAGLFGQSTTSVGGIVTDPTGAVVPQAKLMLENTDTGVVREQESDSGGRYLFAQIPPGNYKLSVKAKGFADILVNDVRLLVSQPATLNVAFEKVGTVSEVVSITAEAVQVNTTDASLGNAIGTKPVLQLPMLTRNIASMLATQPGVVYMGDGLDGLGPNASSNDRRGAVNGGRSDQGNVTLDGIDVNDQQYRYAFTSVLRVTPDSVQEFRVVTLNAGADLGRTSGAQTAIITKSGTNETHGSLYEYLRHHKTAANSFFNNASGVERQTLRRNHFGASVGGPIRKNRLFYFLNWEGRRDSSERGVLRTVPSADLRQGIVKYTRTDGSLATLTPQDIITRVDPLGIGPNPNVLRVLQSYPAPNDFSAGDGINRVGFRFKSPIKVRQNTYIAKLDATLDSAAKHTVFLRGNLQNDHDNDASQFPGLPPNNVNLDNSKGMAVGYTAMLRPNLISVTRYGFTRQGTENTGVSNVSAVTFRNIDDRFGLDRGFTRLIPVNHFTQDFTWIKGSHSVQVGGSMRFIRNSRINYANSFHSASTNVSWLLGTGANLRTNLTDMATTFRTAYYDAIMANLGLVSQVNARYNYDIKGTVQAAGSPVVRKFNAEEYEMYVQDTWKIARALTVQAGVRYNLFPPIYEANGNQTSPSIQLGDWFNTRGGLGEQGRSQTAAGVISYLVHNAQGGRPLYDYHKKNFAPRVSLAYSPQGSSGLSRFLFGGPGRTSIRAGFGMFYDLLGSGLLRLYDSNAFGLSTALTNPSSRLTERTAPRFTAIDQIPAVSQAGDVLLRPAPPGGFPATYPNLFSITNGLDSAIRPPYNMNLNFSIGRELSNGIFIQGSYVGRLSRRALIQSDLSMPTNLKEPQSGMTYFQAAQQLTSHIVAKTPTAQVPRIAFWENMYPGLASGSQTATQAAYDIYNFYYPDATSGLFDLDVACDPTCSKLGPYSMFNAQYSYLSAWRSIGVANYHGMQWTIRKRFRSGDFVDFNYTYSKSMDWRSNTERQGNGFSVINAWFPGQMRSISDYDAQHQLNAGWVLEVPVGRSKKFGSGMNRAVDALVGGWQFSGLFKNTSGFPVSVGQGRSWPTNWNLTGYATQIGPRPAEKTTKNAPSPAAGGRSGPNIFADPAAARAAYGFTFPGETGQRNGVRGDGFFGIDTGLAKRFIMPYSERHSVQFRWEVYNLTNSTRFDPFNANIDLGNSSNFGKYTETFTTPRVMQFALRYEF